MSELNTVVVRNIESNVKLCLNDALIKLGVISEEMYVRARENILKTIVEGGE